MMSVDSLLIGAVPGELSECVECRFDVAELEVHGLPSSIADIPYLISISEATLVFVSG
jgi:hypothetical protein